MTPKIGKTAAALLLASIIAVSASGCGGQNSGSAVTTAESLRGETTTTAESGPQLELPNNLDFKGDKIKIWYFTKNSDVSEHFVNIEGVLDGDVVNEALYYRNLKVEEKLNVDLVFTDTGIASSDVGSAIRTLIMSGSNDYDIYNVVQWNSAKYVTEGLYYNLIDAPYVDVGKPWWSSYYINEVNIGNDSRYFLCGDISIDMIRCISCMYFNKSVYQNYYGSADGMYNMVLDGKWTLDKLFKYDEETYSDLNGDNKVSDGDRMGLYLNSYNNIDILFYGAGLRATTRDKNGLPTLTLNNEKTSAVMKQLYELCYNNKGTMLRSAAEGTLQDNKDFNNGYGLFLMGFLYTSEQLRNMEQDYGIIPSPKSDEKQADYSAVVHDIATLICLPTTCTKVDKCGAVLELMAYESYKSVTPAYYETAMKTKYTRDQLSSQIIDILHDNNMTDIAYVYGDAFNTLGYIGRNMIAGKTSDFASFYATKEPTAITKMQDLINAYQKLK